MEHLTTKIALIAALLFGPDGAALAHGVEHDHEEPSWTCVKDGKVVKVKGKTDKEKKKKCEAKGGAWKKSGNSESEDE